MNGGRLYAYFALTLPNKAIALGAKACFIGRPFNYACAVGGLAGVNLAIDLITSEVSRDLGMLGAASLADLGEKHLRWVG